MEELVTYWDIDPRDGDAALDATLAESIERRRRFSGIDMPMPQTPRCAQIDGYSLHADVSAQADQRDLLERLLRYGARPPFAQSRLSLTRDGQVKYRLRKQYHDGRKALLMEPEAFVRKLALLTPPPWLNLTRFHGLFSPNAKKRPLLRALLPAKQDKGQSSAAVAGLAPLIDPPLKKIPSTHPCRKDTSNHRKIARALVSLGSNAQSINKLSGGSLVLDAPFYLLTIVQNIRLFSPMPPTFHFDQRPRRGFFL